MGALGLAVGGQCAIGAEFERENETNFDFDSQMGKFWCKNSFFVRFTQSWFKCRFYCQNNLGMPFRRVPSGNDALDKCQLSQLCHEFSLHTVKKFPRTYNLCEFVKLILKTQKYWQYSNSSSSPEFSSLLLFIAVSAYDINVANDVPLLPYGYSYKAYYARLG